MPTASFALVLTLKYRKTFYDTIVTIKVRLSQKLFYIRKGLICHYSECFRTALSGDFKESEDVITLASDDEGFQGFYTWLYTGNVIDKNERVDLHNSA
jgi:hypothetical protein